MVMMPPGGGRTAVPGHGEVLEQVFIFINHNVYIHSGQDDTRLQNRQPHDSPPVLLSLSHRGHQW